MTGQSLPSDNLEILETLLPHLKVGAEYAARIQERIGQQPDKSTIGDNPFAAALSDADISIQTVVEVAVLAAYPEARFFGEEYASSVNTKYLSATWWGDADQGVDDRVLLLDPIDGTRYYLDQGEFHVIFSVISRESYEASMFLFPRRRKIIYAVRGRGAFVGDWSEVNVRNFSRLQLGEPILQSGGGEPPVYCSLHASLNESALAPLSVFHLARDYRPGPTTPIHAGLFFGDVSAVVMNSSQLIDGAAIAFVAAEGGAWVSTHSGEPMPPPCSANAEKQLVGFVASRSEDIHRRILVALEKSRNEEGLRQG